MEPTTTKPPRVYVEIRDAKDRKNARSITIYGVDPDQAKEAILLAFANKRRRLRKAG